ncbi:replicative DNA helicase [bacterium]|nr:replicative DNA helicase [bacterium]MBU1072001.1 replicative DNA helicase [bacterium]
MDDLEPELSRAPAPGRIAPGHRLPPQNQDAERAILGAVMLDRDALGIALETIDDGDFYRVEHRTIFQVMCELYENDQAIDGITVAEELERRNALRKVGGNDYLADILAGTATAANVSYHARIVRDKSILRRLIHVSGEIAGDAFEASQETDTILDNAQTKIYHIAENRQTQAFFPVKDVVPETFRRIDEASRSKGDVTGLATGFTELDQRTAGLQNSDLIVLAARPSMGKTALALNIAYHAAVNEKVPVAFFSLEMAKEQLVMRLICASGGFNNHDLRRGHIKPEDWPKLTEACSRLSDAPIFIDDSSGISVLEMKAKARRLRQQHDIGLIVVDYMQLMTGTARAENRQQEISVISRNLKGMAKDLDVPVMALSQLSRAVESRGDHQPLLSDLRESGSIEQDADVVLFLFREEYYKPDDDSVKNRATVNIGKQRNGPIGRFDLHFHKAFTRFGNLQR